MLRIAAGKIRNCLVHIITLKTKINRTKSVVHYIETGALPLINHIEDAVSMGKNKEVL